MGKKQKPKPLRKRRQRQQKQEESRHQQEGLPADVIDEILVRCPVKTLKRFQCVCKQWNFVISKPVFQENHHRQSSRENPLLVQTRRENPLLVQTRCEFNEVNGSKINTLHISTYTSEGTLVNKFSRGNLHQGWYMPIQSCRGLVCIGPKCGEDPIFICNPSTEELISLPPTQEIHHCIGFGYAASTKEFKVVRWFRHPEFEDSQICCEVFILGTSSWREARNPPPQYPPNFFTWGAPFLHGALHMLADYNVDYNHNISIDAFDIDKEEYRKIPLPEYFHTVKNTSITQFYLKEFEGSLCVVFEFGTGLEIWCLSDYHNRVWGKKCFVELNPRTTEFFVDPLVIMSNGNMMLNIEVKKDEALYYYNFRDKSLKKDVTMNRLGYVLRRKFVAPGK